MLRKKVILLAAGFVSAASLISLAGCASKYDIKLIVYNWEDYIYEGVDETGRRVDDSLVEKFEKFYQEQTGKVLKVDYETFSTNEEMYQQIKLGAIAPDVICPSDYMIQKMANEDMLEKFSYDDATGKYGESLSNWDEFGSPYIMSRYEEAKLENGSSFLQYSVPYFWGTVGFTYDSDYFTEEEVGTWEALWNTDAKYKKKFSLKDSMRDTYVAAIFHVYKDEIAALDVEASDYNAQLSAIFNRSDAETLAKVEAALKEAKKQTVYGFEVDEGKDDIVNGKYSANLAWSGDSVYSMDNAENSSANKILNYVVPKEGSNVWFDGWCMPKGANVELAEAFVNFICSPENAALCMDAVGYTSPIAGSDIWDLINDWYAADDEETDVYEADLSFFFGDSISEDAIIKIPSSEKGRQFDAQYPSEETLKRCCIMKDFGQDQEAVEAMWARFKAFN